MSSTRHDRNRDRRHSSLADTANDGSARASLLLREALVRISRTQQCSAWRPGARVGNGGADGEGAYLFSFTCAIVALDLECDLDRRTEK